MKSILLRLCILVSFTALLFSCGGGSRGTGGIIIDGRLFTASGQPVPAAQVSILETGDSSSTGDDGRFEIETTEAPSYSFLIERPGEQSQARIQSVPENARRLEVEIQYRPREESQVTKVEVKETSSSSDDDDSSSGSSSGDDDDGDEREDDDDDSLNSGSSGVDDDDDDSSDESDDNSGSGNDDDDDGDDSSGSGSGDDDDSDDSSNSGSGSDSDDDDEEDSSDSEDETDDEDEVDEEDDISDEEDDEKK